MVVLHAPRGDGLFVPLTRSMLERLRVTSLTDCYSFLARDSFVSTRGARGFVRKVFNQVETKFGDKKPYLLVKPNR